MVSDLRRCVTAGLPMGKSSARGSSFLTQVRNSKKIDLPPALALAVDFPYTTGYCVLSVS
jgi:hypothetical protein